MTSDLEGRKRRLLFRASHRGTKEADIMIGSFVERNLATMSEEDVAWFERFLEENDVEIMAWMIGRKQPPAEFEGSIMDAMRRLDYLPVSR
ncbi:FAD assembly factor SdhE [Pedomonas mirosovicensis]|uniref:FAD assembly factor SdhE n=1 Tax=Pedomonas mirosovicensis TaxID=2908641 RepID=UPI0021670B4B|nr:succinate dehydrogenase assembly factor 2 [Pedomonas mirosovicensis]MCH8685217.1 succinate dehydrogenase assembly factor 2 [Pedomonas mirosovicensis]